MIEMANATIQQPPLEEFVIEWSPELIDKSVHYKRLEKLCRDIKPVRRHWDDTLWYIEPVPPRNWKSILCTDPQRLAIGIQPFAKGRMFYHYGCEGFLRIDILDVVRQIPEKYYGRVVAFEIGERDNDPSCPIHWEHLQHSRHCAKTILYERRQPQYMKGDYPK